MMRMLLSFDKGAPRKTRNINELHYKCALADFFLHILLIKITHSHIALAARWADYKA